MELYASPFRLVRSVAIVLAALATSAWALANDDTPPIVYLCAWAAIVSFLFVLMLICLRAVNIRKPVITLSSDGFLDLRISSAIIPWNVIQEISVGTIRGSSYGPDRPALFLYLSESSWRNFPLKRLLRWMLPLSLKKTRGIEGLCIGHSEFAISFDTFRDIVTAYARAYGVSVNPEATR